MTAERLSRLTAARPGRCKRISRPRSSTTSPPILGRRTTSTARSRTTARLPSPAAAIWRDDYDRRYGNGVLRHGVRGCRIANYKGTDLGGNRRWACPHHARWRQELDKRYAERSTGVEPGQPD